MGKRNVNGDSHIMVIPCTCSFEVIELIGSGNNLCSSLDDFIAFVLMSALSIDFTSALVDKVSVFLCNLAVIGSSHHFL